MKKYSDYTDELTKVEIYDGLVGYGMFADKIPEFLTSVEFLKYSKTKLPFTKVKATDYIRYNSMRNINVPRQLAIPAPFTYANLCNQISNSWINIQEYFRYHTNNQEYKASRIHLRKMKDKKSLFEMNYKNYRMDEPVEPDIWIKSKYVVHADISNFFPSIYSHSIPWVLIGKEVAKKERGNQYKDKWYNKLDENVRNQKYGETNGLLIGPHASNLISEIVLAKVDFQLAYKQYKYMRYIDDFTCYVESYEKAQQFLVDLSDELRKYELILNHKKTEIIPLPQASVKKWVNELSDYSFQNTYISNGHETLRFKELRSFLDFVTEVLLKENSNAAILNYAIKIIAKKRLSSNAKEYYIKRIHHFVLHYPYLIQILDEYVFETHKINKEYIKEIAMDIFEYGKQKRFFEATTYAVFWSLKYNFELDGNNNLYDTAKDSEDAIFLLIAYLYDKKWGNNMESEYHIVANNLARSEFDRYWIFIYEVLDISELQIIEKIYKNMPNKKDCDYSKEEYRLMKQKGKVSFIKLEYRF